MMMLTTADLPQRQAAWPALLGRLISAQRHGMAVGFRAPKPDEDVPDDLRQLIEEEALDEREERPPTAPAASWGAGMALCIPSLVVIGLLYSLLK